MTVKTMILCGGQGTRMREETEYRPKPLVEIGGRPILWHIMKMYSTFGFHEFVLLLSHPRCLKASPRRRAAISLIADVLSRRDGYNPALG